MSYYMTSAENLLASRNRVKQIIEGQYSEYRAPIAKNSNTKFLEYHEP